MLNKLLLASGALCLASTAWAYTVNNSTQWNTNGLTGFTTTGAMMDGMTVKATFLDGGTQTAIWTDNPGTENGGIASGADFLLRESGDTFSNRWTLSSTPSMRAIRSLQIDAGAGNSVFDIIYSSDSLNFGTPGSMNGYFDITLALGGVVADVEFSGPVALQHVLYGDLYRYMTITFSNPEGYVGYNYFRFQGDTDSLRIAGDITPDDGGRVPEPSTVALLGASLLGAAFQRRKVV